MKTDNYKFTPHDLRIGSLICYEDLDGKNHVWTVDGNFLKVLDEQTEKCSEWYSPIPLTEDILLRFGFEKSDQVDKYYIIKNDMGISFADDKIRVIVGNFVCQLVLCELDYVHQLQGIFYELTREMLTLKDR